MTDGRKYYWLKLHESFFEDDTMSFIEDQPNGDQYLIFYLKLCLKSLKSEGRLIRLVGEYLIPYDFTALGKLTGTDVDTVKNAMELFQQIGTVKVLDTGEIYLSQIAEMIGEETEEARRKRRQRAQKGQCPDNVPTVSSKCRTEIRDKEIRDKEIKRLEESNDSNSIATTTKTKRFVKPTLEEVKAYCEERNNNVDPEKWMSYYESNGFMVGKNHMKDWKACIRTWERNSNSTKGKDKQHDDDVFGRRDYRKDSRGWDVID